jgi:hypothetical protein
MIDTIGAYVLIGMIIAVALLELVSTRHERHR